MAKMKNFVSRIPDEELGEVRMPYPSGNLYLITYCRANDLRSLWRKTENGYERLLTSETPQPLYDRVAAEEMKLK